MSDFFYFPKFAKIECGTARVQLHLVLFLFLTLTSESALYLLLESIVVLGGDNKLKNI